MGHRAVKVLFELSGLHKLLNWVSLLPEYSRKTVASCPLIERFTSRKVESSQFYLYNLSQVGLIYFTICTAYDTPSILIPSIQIKKNFITTLNWEMV